MHLGMLTALEAQDVGICVAVPRRPKALEVDTVDPALFSHGHDTRQIVEVRRGYHGRERNFQTSVDSCFHPRDNAIETAGLTPKGIMNGSRGGIEAHEQLPEFGVLQLL